MCSKTSSRLGVTVQAHRQIDCSRSSRCSGRCPRGRQAVHNHPTASRDAERSMAFAPACDNT